jgi:hypothetical protein
VNRALKSARTPTQEPLRGANLAHPQPNQGLGIADSPYLTLDEGARFCRFDATSRTPVVHFRRWLHREAVPIRRRGRVLLVERRVLEAVMEAK